MCLLVESARDKFGAVAGERDTSDLVRMGHVLGTGEGQLPGFKAAVFRSGQQLIAASIDSKRGYRTSMTEDHFGFFAHGLVPGSNRAVGASRDQDLTVAGDSNRADWSWVACELAFNRDFGRVPNPHDPVSAACDYFIVGKEARLHGFGMTEDTRRHWGHRPELISPSAPPVTSC